MDAVEIHIALAEAEPGFRAARVHLINETALLFLIGRAGVEHHAVTWFQRAAELQRNLFVRDPGDLPQKHPALLPETRVNQFLIVVAAEPAGVKPARKSHLHVVTILLIVAAAVKRLIRIFREWGLSLLTLAATKLIEFRAVNARDIRHVFRRFEPALDLQRRHARTDDVWQDLQPGEVLRAEQILPVAERHWFSVRDQIVGHPAGLCALATIRRAAPQRFAREALAGVRNAERPVDEDFEREGKVPSIQGAGCSSPRVGPG